MAQSEGKINCHRKVQEKQNTTIPYSPPRHIKEEAVIDSVVTYLFRINNKMAAKPHKRKQREKPFLLDYLENLKASLSLEIQQHIFKTLGIYTHHHQTEHHSTHTAPSKRYPQCCQ